jgi:hypothetical protein
VKKKLGTQMHIIHIFKLSTKQYNSRPKPWVSQKLKTPIKMQDETMPNKKNQKKKKDSNFLLHSMCFDFKKNFMHLHVHLGAYLCYGIS